MDYLLNNDASVVLWPAGCTCTLTNRLSPKLLFSMLRKSVEFVGLFSCGNEYAKVEVGQPTCFETAVARSEPGRITIRAKACCNDYSVLISWRNRRWKLTSFEIITENCNKLVRCKTGNYMRW